MNDQSIELLNKWLTLLSNELILIPVLAGLALGYLVSISPYISRMKRSTDRQFWVYTSNAVSSGAVFIMINYNELETALSMLCLVMASSVLLPYIYFSRIKKR